MFSLFGCGKIGQVMDGDGMILKINGEEYHSGGHSRTETDPSTIGPNPAVCFLSGFYAVIIEFFCCRSN